MQSGDILAETATALTAAVDSLGGSASAGVLFNCILRRLELDPKDQTQAFVGTFAKVPVAGFHTYGESWLGHMNQTLTGVLSAEGMHTVPSPPLLAPGSTSVAVRHADLMQPFMLLARGLAGCDACGDVLAAQRRQRRRRVPALG